MVADQHMFKPFPHEPEDAVASNRIWMTIIYSFLFLVLYVWTNELLDMPHLMFGAEKTPVNWYEALSETFLICIVGVFALSRTYYTPSLRKTTRQAFELGNIWLPLAFVFILLSSLIWLNELIDLPHILFNGQSTPVNWAEALSESIIILGIGAFSVSVLIRNVAERERAESRIRKEKMFSNTLIQTSPIFFVAISPEGRTMMMNNEMLSVLGYELDEAQNRDFISTFVPAREHDLYRAEYRELVKSSEVRHAESHILTKDGREMLVEWYGRSILAEDSTVDFFFFLGSDITQRKHVENELKNYQDQLRSLNVHSEQVRERERTRIACELHDELGQMLTVLKMDLAYVNRHLPGEKGALTGKIQDMDDRVDQTLSALRRIMTDLRPSLLDNLGLVAAIEWQAEDFQKHTGIPCGVTVEPEDMSPDPDTSTTVFRIFQETLTNIARHAHAEAVTVKLEKTGDELRLVVQDDGIGIIPEKISYPRSYGLMGIRERVTYCGGKVQISGSPGKGTTVSVAIPLGSQIKSDC